MEKDSYHFPVLVYDQSAQYHNDLQKTINKQSIPITTNIDIIPQISTSKNTNNIQKKYVKLINKLIERTTRLHMIYLQSV